MRSRKTDEAYDLKLLDYSLLQKKEGLSSKKLMAQKGGMYREEFSAQLQSRSQTNINLNSLIVNQEVKVGLKVPLSEDPSEKLVIRKARKDHLEMLVKHNLE